MLRQTVADPEILNRERAEGYGVGSGEGAQPRKFWKILCKNNAFCAKFLTCFKFRMHPVSRGGRQINIHFSLLTCYTYTNTTENAN